MSSIERKLKRKNATKAKKNAEKELATKVALFGKLPDKCLACEADFDKNNKEQVASWSVVVREKEETVRLYCPPCWKMAVEIIEGFKEHIKEKNESRESH